MGTKIEETTHGHVEMPDHYTPDAITEDDLQNDPCLRIVREDELGLTEIRIERDDDFDGDFDTDEDFERFVELYDSCEVTAVARATKLDDDCIFVQVHRNTSGFRDHISWVENDAREFDDGSTEIGSKVRMAMGEALAEAWALYDSEQD